MFHGSFSIVFQLLDNFFEFLDFRQHILHFLLTVTEFLLALASILAEGQVFPPEDIALLLKVSYLGSDFLMNGQIVE